MGSNGTPLFCPQRPKAPWRPKVATTSTAARYRPTTTTATRAAMATATTATMVTAMMAVTVSSPPSSPILVLQLTSDGDDNGYGKGDGDRHRRRCATTTAVTKTAGGLLEWSYELHSTKLTQSIMRSLALFPAQKIFAPLWLYWQHIATICCQHRRCCTSNTMARDAFCSPLTGPLAVRPSNGAPKICNGCILALGRL